MADNSNIDNLSGSEDDFDMDGIEGGQDGPSTETLQAIAALKATLETNPNQYELHTQLIAFLKSADMFEELRQAREAMNKIYPLSEELWKDWIEDEANMATSEDEKRHVLSLYERAISEYLSIKIWKAYIDYALQEYNETKEYQEADAEDIVVSAEDLTKIFKRADKWTGYHIPESHIIWNVWIDFELENLALKDPASPEDIKRVKKMYLDRIAIPHATLEETFSALSSFISKYEPEEYEKSMVHCNGIAAATRKLLSERQTLEQNLEIYHKSEDEVSAVFASALSDATLLTNPQELSKVFQARCSYVVRTEKKDEDGKAKIRAAFEHARDVLDSVGGDPYCKLEQFWIEIEAGPLENAENARALWTKIEGKLKASSESWLARVALEKRLGDPKQARRIFVQACNAAKQIDWPEKIFEAWLLFEREHGTVSEYKEALTRSRAAMKNVEHFRVEAALKGAYVDQSAYAVAVPAAPVEAPTTVTDKKRKVSFQDEGESSKVAKVENSRPKGKGKAKAGADQTPADSEPDQPRKPLDVSAGRHEDTCFVANFTHDMTEAKLKEMFSEYGTVLRCTMAQPKQGKARFFAYVQFSKPEEAHAALALDGRDVGHRLGLQVKISDTTAAKRAPPTAKPPLPKQSRHELHISGLKIEVKDEELRKLISLYAEPEEIYVERKPTAKGGTWANAKFHAEADADAAVAMDGLSFQGETLVVKRRVFKNPDYEGLTRTDIRKLKAKRSAEKRAQGGSQAQQQAGAESGDDDVGMSESVSAPAEATKAEPTTFVKPAAVTKPATKLTAMAPRTMAPRTMQPRSMQGAKPIKGKPHRTAGTGTPLGAFKPASTNTTTAAASESSGDASSAAAGTGKEGEGGEAAAPVAPKSNAEFRALMLSGALKKTRQ
ncbi:RNA-binding protein 4F [Mortierella sp. NVP41]|nr:RNA-binding protein 4F [Mortierella sp. NVP41]